MNQTTIAGHLGSDPEVRFTSSGQKVTVLRVAARTRKTNKEDKENTIWWRVTIWGDQFDKMIPYFKKGSPIIVLGDLNKPEIFTDREGRSQVSMSLTALNLMFSPFGRPDQPGHAETHEGNAFYANPTPHAATTSNGAHEMAYAHTESASAYGQGKMDTPFSDDEIPF